MNFIRYLKNNIKKNKLIFWSFFHPDNLLNFKFANKSEIITWKFVIKEMDNYKSLCEIGCFNGRSTFILRKFFRDKKYIGYDINIFAIFIANILNSFIGSNRNFFYNKNASLSSKENCELFISIATLIYFSEEELIQFINNLKKNKLFKALVMHEIFLKEDNFNVTKTLVEDNLNIHSINMIKKKFGNEFKINTIRTYYSNWEKKGRISAILCIKKLNLN